VNVVLAIAWHSDVGLGFTWIAPYPLVAVAQEPPQRLGS